MPTLIIGLGNPGKKYELTRHNVGFMTVDALVQELNAPPFKVKKRFHALVTETAPSSPPYQGGDMREGLIIAKPHTFMNLSGKTVRAMVRAYCNTPLPQSYGQGTALPLLITSDDIDLPLGTIRYREKGGAGGHNGLQSIIETLGTQEFPRLKIGVRPPHLARQPGKAEEFVLKPFTHDELMRLKKEIIPQAIETILERIKSQCTKPNFQ